MFATGGGGFGGLGGLSDGSMDVIASYQHAMAQQHANQASASSGPTPVPAPRGCWGEEGVITHQRQPRHALM